MDTKSKKWKKAVSFLAFAIGIMLTVSGGLGVAERLWGRGYGNLYEKDYQNTRSFQHMMTGYLDDFLSMATGGNVTGYDAGYDQEYWEYIEKIQQETIAQGGVTQEVTGLAIYDGSAAANDYWGDYWDGYDYDDEEGIDPAKLKELREKAAQAAHKWLSQDKNLLYTITCDGKILYTNAEGTVLNGLQGTLPEGYNFLLYFDGEKAAIQKDGKAVDIYGDGYYREESDSWCVPGYKNFTADENTRRVTVTMAAAKEPVLYISGDYSDSGSKNYRWNGLYELQYRMQQRQADFIVELSVLGAGLFFLLLYILMRRHKKEADRALARVTGAIWFEVKLLLAVGAPAALLYASWDAAYRIFGTDIFYIGVTSVIEEMGGMNMGWIIDSSICFWSVFWVLYLFINDLRYGKKAVLNNSLCRKIARLSDTSAMKLPVQKRLMRPYRWTVGIAAGAVGALAVLLFSLAVYYRSPEWSLGVLGLVICLAAAMGWLLLRGGRAYRRSAEEVGALTRQIDAVQKGDYAAESCIPADSGLREASDKLRDVQEGLEAAVDRQMKSERMKVELITNVSHDIKTPLTSVISYVELLKQEKDLPEHIRDYIRVLDEKSQRLKTMVQDVFEVSKAAAGQLPVKIERLDLARLVRQTLADMQPQIAASAVSVKEEIPTEPVMIIADGQRLYRVLQNLLQNALTYSLDGSRVYLALTQGEEDAAVRIRNISRDELATEIDFTQRFVRGDQSRSDGGSGLGLSIAQSFTEACGGRFSVTAEGDVFTVTISFKLAGETAD